VDYGAWGLYGCRCHYVGEKKEREQKMTYTQRSLGVDFDWGAFVDTVITIGKGGADIYALIANAEAQKAMSTSQSEIDALNAYIMELRAEAQAREEQLNKTEDILENIVKYAPFAIGGIVLLLMVKR
jgi:hypothetical protein